MTDERYFQVRAIGDACRDMVPAMVDIWEDEKNLLQEATDSEGLMKDYPRLIQEMCDVEWDIINKLTEISDMAYELNPISIPDPMAPEDLLKVMDKVAEKSARLYEK